MKIFEKEYIKNIISVIIICAAHFIWLNSELCNYMLKHINWNLIYDCLIVFIPSFLLCIFRKQSVAKRLINTVIVFMLSELIIYVVLIVDILIAMENFE